MVDLFYHHKETADYTRTRVLFLTIEKDRHFDFCSFVRIFGYSVYKKILFGQQAYHWLFGFPWRTNLDRTTMDKLVNERIVRTVNDLLPSSCFVNLIGSPSGEVFLFSCLWKQFRQKYQIRKDCVFVVDSNWKKRLVKYLFRSDRCVNIQLKLFVHDSLCYRHGATVMFNVFPITHYLRQDEKNLREGYHYFDAICSTLGLHKNKVCVPPAKFSVREKIKKFCNREFPGKKIVLVCPDANTCGALEKRQWLDLCTRVRERGFSVFVNSSDATFQPYTCNCFFTHEELLELARHSVAVIGLRSGLTEMLAAVGIPSFIVYTGLPPRGVLEAMSAEQVLRGFTLTELPGLEKNNIHEYLYSDSDWRQITSDALSKICSLTSPR